MSFLLRIRMEAQKQAQQLNHQDISNGLWAMAALDVDLEDQVTGGLGGAQMEVSPNNSNGYGYGSKP